MTQGTGPLDGALALRLSLGVGPHYSLTSWVAMQLMLLKTLNYALGEHPGPGVPQVTTHTSVQRMVQETGPGSVAQHHLAGHPAVDSLSSPAFVGGRSEFCFHLVN